MSLKRNVARAPPCVNLPRRILAGDRQTASACWLLGNSAAFDDGLLYAAVIFEERPPEALDVDPCWLVD